MKAPKNPLALVALVAACGFIAFGGRGSKTVRYQVTWSSPGAASHSYLAGLPGVKIVQRSDTGAVFDLTGPSGTHTAQNLKGYAFGGSIRAV